MVDFPSVDFLHDVFLVGQFVDCRPGIFSGPHVRLFEEMIVSGFPGMPIRNRSTLVSILPNLAARWRSSKVFKAEM